ncbi:MAG TPA: hypothetical protein VM345_01785 [Acidimicrobiales bacterium]|nr:hypothetical protein [Acidimicrobiales bacterium]
MTDSSAQHRPEGGRSRQTASRAASHPDDPSASFADRLLLALGIWPVHVNELGQEAAIEAAVQFRWDAHRFPMVCEDFGTERELRTELTKALRGVETILANAYGHAEARYEPQALEALALVREALTWVDDPHGELADECPTCGALYGENGHDAESCEETP